MKITTTRVTRQRPVGLAPDAPSMFLEHREVFIAGVWKSAGCRVILESDFSAGSLEDREVQSWLLGLGAAFNDTSDRVAPFSEDSFDVVS